MKFIASQSNKLLAAAATAMLMATAACSGTVLDDEYGTVLISNQVTVTDEVLRCGMQLTDEQFAQARINEPDAIADNVCMEVVENVDRYEIVFVHDEEYYAVETIHEFVPGDQIPMSILNEN